MKMEPSETAIDASITPSSVFARQLPEFPSGCDHGCLPVFVLEVNAPVSEHGRRRIVPAQPLPPVEGTGERVHT